MAVVGVHSVRVWRWTLVCSSEKTKDNSCQTETVLNPPDPSNPNTHVGCCIILRLWTSILWSISCWWSLCTEGPKGGIWCNKVWWSAGRCWVRGALELERGWVVRAVGGAGGTVWLDGWDDNGAGKVRGIRNPPCWVGWGVSWGFPWEWGQTDEDWWCSERVREPSEMNRKEGRRH